MRTNRNSRLAGMFCILILCFSMAEAGTVCAGAAKVKLNRSQITVEAGKSFLLKAACPKKYRKKLHWRISDQRIAAVCGNAKKTCRIKAKKAGKTKVTVSVKGTKVKAVCRLTIKKKKISPDSTKTASPEETAVSTEALATPEPTKDAVSEPVMPVAPTEPVSQQVLVDSSVLVVTSQAVTVDGTQMRAYLVNKRYVGEITVRLFDSTYTIEDTGRNLINLLANGATTKQNHDGTIRVSRESTAEEYWTMQDTKHDATYYFKASKTNTLWPGYADCGVIYVLGDVQPEFAFFGKNDTQAEEDG